MISLFHGADAYRRDAAIARLVASLGDQSALAFNTTRLDASTTLAAIAGAADTLPFMADHRLVLIDQLGTRFEPKREADTAEPAGGPEFHDGLQAYAARRPPWAVIVFRDDRLRATNPLLKAVQSAGSAEAFLPLAPDALARWLETEAGQRGGRFAPGAAMALAGDCPDSWTASLELDKLLAYAGERPISRDAIRLLTPHQLQVPDLVIFQILDAALARRTDAALAALHHALADDRHPLAILATLATLLRNIVTAGAWLERDLPDADLQPALGLKPGQLPNRLRQARQWGPDRSRRALRAIAMTDLAIKTGTITPEVGLDLLVTDLAR